MGGRQLRPDPTGRRPAGGRTRGGNFLVAERGEAKQNELVGMTAVAESGVVELSSYLTVVSSL